MNPGIAGVAYRRWISQRGRSLGIGTIAVLASCSLVALAAAPPCTTFDLQGLRPGMTLAQTRTAMKGTEDRLEVSGVETVAEFRRGESRVAATFPDRVTSRSKTGLTAVRWCVGARDHDYATFAGDVRSQFGEPTAGAVELDSGLRGGGARWESPGCRVEVRVFRQTQWWDPSSDDLCIDVRVVPTPKLAAAPTSSAGSPSEPAVATAALAGEGPGSPAGTRAASTPSSANNGHVKTGPMGDAAPAGENGHLAAREVAIFNPPVEHVRERAPIDLHPDPPSLAAAAVIADPPPVAEPLVPRERARERPPVDPPPTSLRAAPPATEDTAPENDSPAGDAAKDDDAESGKSGATTSAPRLIASTPAQYPAELRSRKISARVVVRARVLADGSVGRIEVIECSRPGFGFENRVIAAVRMWRYEPALQAGYPVTSEILIPFSFE